MKKIALVGFGLGAAVLFSGCATIFKGSNQTVSFNSQPEGAIVYIDDVEVGNTPIALKLKKGRSKVVTIKKEGYVTATRPLETEFDTLAVLGTATYSVPMLTDVVGGAAYEYMPNTYHFSLKKKD